MSTNPENTENTGEAQFEIPKTCKAGVVVNEGPDFRVEVQDVPVPEPGRSFFSSPEQQKSRRTILRKTHSTGFIPLNLTFTNAGMPFQQAQTKSSSS